MFKEVAKGLARAGVASVRVDNSGVGKSTGAKVAHFRERVPQFGEVLKEMRKRRELVGVPIGLLGHSEGSLVATELWLSHADAIDFMVLVGAPGQPGRKVWVDQQSNPERFPGKDAKTLAEIRSSFEQVADASIAENESALSAAADRLFIITGLTPEQVEEIRPDFIRRMASAEMRVFLAHDPAKAFTLVQVPVLAIWGTHDRLTEPSSNAPIFLKNRNPASALTAIVLPNEDHFFLRGEGLPPGKHEAGKMHLSDRLVSEIVRFIIGLNGSTRSPGPAATPRTSRKVYM
jgi:pimeloyl-ACP methyl ester carboxylesterase